MFAEWAPIVGIVTGSLAAAGTIYGFGFKFSKLETRVNLIWTVFVEDALRNQVRSGLLTHSSPYAKTEYGESLGEVVSPEINKKINKRSFKTDHELATALIKEIGLNTIINKSQDMNITVQEFLALGVCTLKNDGV
jgi:hypothetical protein